MLNIVFCLLFLESVVQGLEANAKGEVNLATPSIYGISEFEVNETIIHWLPVDDNGDEPVLGYKAKMWEVGCVEKRKYKTVDGNRRLVKELVMPWLRDYSTLRNVQEFTLKGLGNSNLFLRDLPEDVPYHIVVSAYSASGEGPQSAPFRFQVRGRFNCRH